LEEKNGFSLLHLDHYVFLAFVGLSIFFQLLLEFFLNKKSTFSFSAEFPDCSLILESTEFCS